MKDYQQIYQGDIWLMKLPNAMEVTTDAEIPALHGKLILQEGEMTGHHHYVETTDVLDRTAPSSDPDIDFSVLNKGALKDILGGKRKEATAKFYNATKVADALVKEQILLRADLVVGLLKVDGGPAKVSHQEHETVMLAPGNYIVGRQIESVAGEERRVAD